MARREISVIVSGNYTANAWRLAVPLWLARVIAVLLGLGVLVAMAGIVLALALSAGAARVAYLEERNRKLEVEMSRVGQLKRELAQLEEQSRRLAVMLGVDRTPPPVNWDSAPGDTASLPEWMKGQAWGSQPVPRFRPCDGGVLSRLFSLAHPGVDLAAVAGSPVRSSADGVVSARGADRTFGNYLLVAHAQGYESYYAHLQDWNVDRGDTVSAGQTIGWVGSTGKSTAPHLHFEVRKDGRRLDPATMVTF